MTSIDTAEIREANGRNEHIETLQASNASIMADTILMTSCEYTICQGNYQNHN